jgi:hypothetical protein
MPGVFICGVRIVYPTVYPGAFFPIERAEETIAPQAQTQLAVNFCPLYPRKRTLAA